jgi:WD40 repeat protein
VSFSSDNQFVIAGSRTKGILFCDVKTGEVAHHVADDFGIVTHVASSGLSNSLIFYSNEGALIVWDVETNEPLTKIELASKNIRAVALSSDGKTLAVATGGPEILLQDAVTGQSRGQLVGHSAAVTSLAFSMDGQLLASGGEDDVIKLWGPMPSRLTQFWNGPTVVKRAPAGKMRLSAIVGHPKDTYESSKGSANSAEDIPGEIVVQTGSCGRNDGRSPDSRHDGYVFGVGGKTIALSENDIGQTGTWTVVSGTEGAFSDGVDVLSDGFAAAGNVTSKSDAVDDNEVFGFQGPAAGIFQVDLGAEFTITEINAYSSNRNSDQKYVLSGSCDGESFSTIVEVDTTRNGKHAFRSRLFRPCYVVSITSTNSTIGKYRYLRWTGNIATQQPRSANEYRALRALGASPFEGTFYREIDIFGEP